MDRHDDAPAFFVSVSSSETTVVSDGYTTTSVSTITTESIYFSRNLYARAFGGSTRITTGSQQLASLLRRYVATSVAQWSPTRRVLKAMDATGSEVIIKVFVPAENSTVAYVAARKEAAILSKLGGKHHIVPVLELMDLPELDSYVLIMPYIASDPAAIRTSAATTRKCMRQLLEALQFIHTSGYLHLDITPDNILYDPRSGSLTLIDFSHAISLSEEPHADVGGARRYMPPEVLKVDRPRIGPASDIWSAGTVLAEWICGRSIFKGESNEEVLESIAAAFPRGEFSFDFWASEDAKSLLRLMLCLNAQNRAAITELLRHPYVRTP